MSTVDPRLLRFAFMQLTREFDARFSNLLLSGRVTKWYSEIGNEATTVPAGLGIAAGDVLCSLHRDLGAILAVYLDPARTFPEFGLEAKEGRRPDPERLLYRLACQLLGRHEGFSQGIERSFHYAYRSPQAGIHHLGMISHLGAMVPVAAGCAFALQRQASDRVVVNFLGDGGTSTGDFHEGLNIAAVWKLPLVLVVENNRYAFSTPTHLQYAARRLSDRGIGYGIAAETVDGNDPDAMAQAIDRAVTRARRGMGPSLIEAMLGRMRGHSEGDDSLKVVPESDLEEFLAADPVPRYRARLISEGVLTDEIAAAVDRRVGDLVESSVNAALAASSPELSTASRPVFAVTGSTPEEAEHGAVSPPPPPREISYIEGIHQALMEAMQTDSSVILLGQDIGAFEGAFRATRGLHTRWPQRVFDTPIAESGALGVAIGASLFGFRPVVEMQFADFVTCGFNQLVNLAAKLYYRWEIPCPIVVRLPSGGGVNAGPFHSQNPEGWFTHVAGLKIVCPATVQDARDLLLAAIRDPNPVLVFEHKYLYRRIKASLTPPPEDAVLGRARVVREGVDVTLVGYGASTWICLEAADSLASEGVSSEVIDLRTLVPFDEATLLHSVRKTGRVLIVHEAQQTSGFGAEVAARLADRGFFWLDAPVKRLAYPDSPIPYAKELESVLLPNAGKVAAEVRELLRQ